MIIKCKTERIKLGFVEMHDDPKAVDVVMWYDRHYRHWVIYPVDAEGNQLEEASYGFGKAEALAIKAEMLKEIKEGK